MSERKIHNCNFCTLKGTKSNVMRHMHNKHTAENTLESHPGIVCSEHTRLLKVGSKYVTYCFLCHSLPITKGARFSLTEFTPEHKIAHAQKHVCAPKIPRGITLGPRTTKSDPTSDEPAIAIITATTEPSISIAWLKEQITDLDGGCLASLLDDTEEECGRTVVEWIREKESGEEKVRRYYMHVVVERDALRKQVCELQRQVDEKTARLRAVGCKE